MNIHDMPGHLIRRLQQHSTQVFTKEMQDVAKDLTSVQFAAMDAIFANPGIDQAGVAAKIAYDRATIGGVIDRLEQKGFVERKVNTRDRRARILRLTASGEEMLAQILPHVTALQDDILPGLDPVERDTFLALARKALENAAPS